MSSRIRISVPLTEKKRYAEMIMKGASRSTISDLYRKKYKSELPERTFFAWKKQAQLMVEVDEKEFNQEVEVTYVRINRDPDSVGISRLSRTENTPVSCSNKSGSPGNN